MGFNDSGLVGSLLQHYFDVRVADESAGGDFDFCFRYLLNLCFH